MTAISPGAGADEGVDDERGVAVDDEIETRSGQVDAAGHGQRLDRWLAGFVPEFSRTHLQRLIEAGDVQVQPARRMAASMRLNLGDRVQVELKPPAQAHAFRPEAWPLSIVYEDEHLLVVDKPAGRVMHPAAGHWSGTVLNALLAHHARAAELPRAGIVHRLDKDTSGLFVAGKTLEATRALSEAIARREVHREYLALVQGRPTPSGFTIDAPIGRDPVSRVRMAVVRQGREARTDVEVLRSAELPGGGPVSLVRCTLHTGRTHQIRVHLAARGHALVGDRTYGGRVVEGFERQALHARCLALTHPLSGQTLRWTAPCPADLTLLIRRAWPTDGQAFLDSLQ